MWTHFFRDGGFGMYPTVVFGFLLVASGALCLLRPERRFAAVAAVLGVATLASGLLGTCVGLITTFRYLPQVALDQRLTIAALGCAESLNNAVLALILVVFTAILGVLATARVALSPDAPRAA
jgi:hypothetical protein